MKSREMIELITELAGTPHFLQEALASVTSDRWDVRVPGIEFSLRQQFCHLRDVELEGHLVRVFRIAAEASPRLLDLDGTRLAHERRYVTQDAVAAVRDFVTLRAITIARLQHLSPDGWKRKGSFGGGPEFELRELVAMMHAHDKQHCDEIAALLAAAPESHAK
jgi:hypothetical protein